MRWNLLFAPKQPGAWQMALDQVLLERMEAGSIDPVLRFYTWEPWCITLGNFQTAVEQVNLAAAQRAGVDVVQRITGGRAVFHAEEVTYTICAPKSIAPWGKTLGQTYDWVSERLLEGLQRIGFHGDLERSASGPLEVNSQRHLVKPPCFSSASRAEIVWQGRKLVGSAQRRTKQAFLQHGSIVWGDAHLGLVDLLEFPEVQKPAILADLQSHSVSLGQIPGCATDPETIISALVQGFAGHLDLQAWELPADIIADVEKRLKT